MEKFLLQRILLVSFKIFELTKIFFKDEYGHSSFIPFTYFLKAIQRIKNRIEKEIFSGKLWAPYFSLFCVLSTKIFSLVLFQIFFQIHKNVLVNKQGKTRGFGTNFAFHIAACCKSKRPETLNKAKMFRLAMTIQKKFNHEIKLFVLLYLPIVAPFLSSNFYFNCFNFLVSTWGRTWEQQFYEKDAVVTGIHLIFCCTRTWIPNGLIFILSQLLYFSD